MEPKPPDAPEAAAGSTSTFTAQSHGAMFKTLHMEREMKCYPIYESELRTLNVFSGIVTAMASAFSGTFGYMSSVAWDVATGTAATASVGKVVMTLCGVLMLVFAGIGYWAHRTRETDLEKITKASRFVP